MALISFGRQVCGDLQEASAREWLVTDGLGGYAMGTVAGVRTRRYHGLLVVTGGHAGERRVGLTSLDLVVHIGDRSVRLAAHRWANGVVDPAGFQHLESFEIIDGVPQWRWRIGPYVLEREIAMTYGRPAVGVTHRLVHGEGSHPIHVEAAAVGTWRDAHGERFAGDGSWPDVGTTADGYVFENAYRVAGPGFRSAGDWWRGSWLPGEAERGLNAVEDVFHAGTFAAELREGDSLDILAWAGDTGEPPPPAAEIVATARQRSRAVQACAGASDGTAELLAHAADQFVIATPSGPTVVAGYPWFGEWSRDTMTSYEGLFLNTGRHDEGRACLERAAATVSEGMLANTADAGGLEYNTADGTLWFVHAVGRHVAVTGDHDLSECLRPTLTSIVEHHVNGTRFNIHVAEDGLLAQGAEGWALTWMDARVGTLAVTPRAGKAVEIQALWCNALGTLLDIYDRPGLGGPGSPTADLQRWESLRESAVAAFTRRFRKPDAGLLDVVDTPAGRDDASIRPNQLLALSLPFGPAKGPHPVEVCRRHLLTSVGMRSLSPDDPAYIPTHRGGPWERDQAYHQGTVWPWLIGPYVSAAVANGVPVDGVLDGLERHLHEWGLGSVSETADAEPPHATTGCPFQAWSVAELLRARAIA